MDGWHIQLISAILLLNLRLCCMKNKLYSLLVFLLFLAGSLPLWGQQSKNLQIEYVGNMGVAITKGDTAILIDALHDYYKDAYLPSSPAFLDKLFEKRSPYKTVPAILVTHKHDDHFDSALIRKALDSHPEAKLLTGKQLDAFLYNRYKGQYQLADDALAYAPAANIDIKLKKIKHTYQQRHSGVHNYRVDITWNEKRIIHIGDALDIEESLSGLNKVDVLIIPFWHFLDKGNVRHIEKLRPAMVILTHISPEGSPAAYVSDIIKPIEFNTYGQKVNL